MWQILGRTVLHVGLWGLVKWLEKQAATELTDDKAQQRRRHVEDKLYRFTLKPQKGWRSRTDVDDKAMRHLQVILKSRWLDQKISESRP